MATYLVILQNHFGDVEVDVFKVYAPNRLEAYREVGAKVALALAPSAFTSREKLRYENEAKELETASVAGVVDFLNFNVHYWRIEGLNAVPHLNNLKVL